MRRYVFVQLGSNSLDMPSLRSLSVFHAKALNLGSLHSAASVPQHRLRPRFGFKIWVYLKTWHLMAPPKNMHFTFSFPMAYYHIVCILQANPSCEKILNHILQSHVQLSPLTTGCGWRVGWSLMAPSVGWVSGILGFWSYGVSYSSVWFISSFCDQRLWRNMISGDYSNFMSINFFFTITKVPCPQGREPRLLKYMVSLRACWSTRSSWTKAEMDEIWNSRWRDWACRKKV